MDFSPIDLGFPQVMGVFSQVAGWKGPCSDQHGEILGERSSPLDLGGERVKAAEPMQPQSPRACQGRNPVTGPTGPKLLSLL